MKKTFVLLVLIGLICANASHAVAQEEHGEKAGQKVEERHEESAVHLAARWVNFAILIGGLAYVLRKPMAAFFHTRRNDIITGLQRAQDAQASAKARMDEIEQRVASLGAEVSALRADADHESLLDREKILAEAKREVDRVLEQSRQEIERIARTVEREIKENVADQVIERAGNQLRTVMTQDDQNRVVLRFIKKL